ncbi:hypothetical protein GF339_22980, partial [candidate division KSB3 bacterium]|nr:hypothetical protein [candidate division KSB3 bacterium]MBD3327468.1 hypothetical protein [candidate division KSB3 bacterium]
MRIPFSRKGENPMHRFRRRRLIGAIWRRIKQVFRLLKNLIAIIVIVTILLYLIALGWFYFEFTAIPEVKEHTVLVMNFHGLILDGPSLDPVSKRLLAEDVQTRQGVINNIRKAAGDPRIVGILLKMKGFAMTRTTAVEIREALLQFRESGKPVFAYMENAGMGTYLLSSAADTLYMPPSGAVFVSGFRAEVPFYKGTFDKIGIVPEFIAIGEHKTAPQVFTMDHMSDEFREYINTRLDSLYYDFLTHVTETRQVAVETVEQWIDAGLFSAPDALEAGLIDALHYEHQLEKTLKIELGLLDAEELETESEEESEEPPLPMLNNSQYARVKVDVPNLHNTGEKIAVVYAQGAIVSGESSPPSSRDQFIGSDTMADLFAYLTEDEEIKGIILRINSGGGAAGASDIIRSAVQQAAQEKPVVVSMADMAASGAYMASAPADSIVAYPLTLTGSIGIFGGKFSFQGIYDFIGMNVETL